MNETQTAYAIVRALDRGTEQLSDDVTDRLAVARSAALDAYAGKPAVARDTGRAKRSRRDTPPLFQRLAIAGVPAFTIVFGLVMIGQWSEQKRIEQVAELDAAVLLDDLPIAAYADKGFGVYLKNTRQWAGLATDELASASNSGQR
ncbi:MAG: DUF3619 family protein [Burkholderiaceae bacterium]